eukprot:2451315-Amphidinium_carterae.1
MSTVEAQQQQGQLSRAASQNAVKEAFMKLQKFEQAEKGEDFVADNVGCTAISVLVRHKVREPQSHKIGHLFGVMSPRRT